MNSCLDFFLFYVTLILLMSSSTKHTVKIGMAGDAAVGKTSWWYCYKAGKHDFGSFEYSVPYDEYSTDIEINGKEYFAKILDTTGQEEYARLRAYLYTQWAADVFLVFFSVVNPSSFENVREVWVPEVRYLFPKVPILLIGIQTDLRQDSASLANLRKQKQQPISPQMGDQLAREINALKYLECSCVTTRGIRNVLYEAIWAAIGFKAEEHFPPKSRMKRFLRSLGIRL